MNKEKMKLSRVVVDATLFYEMQPNYPQSTLL
jgi:hypothetical protein